MMFIFRTKIAEQISILTFQRGWILRLDNPPAARETTKNVTQINPCLYKQEANINIKSQYCDVSYFVD